MMIPNIDNPFNKERIALVAVGYNRLPGLKRLLDSLKNARYYGDDVPLVISIDCSGDERVYNFVREYEWPHGDKYVNIQEVRLGLKEHIFQCGDLTRYFKAIALFEDDIWASPFFYPYLKKTVDKYGLDDRICEIALYTNEQLGYAGLPLKVLHNGTDCFLWQDVSTWGQCWTANMWDSFRSWLDNHEENYYEQVDMPDRIKGWTRAWSKYYLAYEIETHRHVVFPYESLTTNFSEAGEHSSELRNNAVQVNVLFGLRDYHLADVEELVCYDIYTNNEQLYKWLPEQYQNDTCLDVYGYRSSYNGKRYVLSMKLLPYAVVREWGMEMRPVELNVLYNIEGEGIRLYDTSSIVHLKRERYKYYTKQTIGYFLQGFSKSYLVGYVKDHLKDRFLHKLRLKG